MCEKNRVRSQIAIKGKIIVVKPPSSLSTYQATCDNIFKQLHVCSSFQVNGSPTGRQHGRVDVHASGLARGLISKFH